MESLAKKYPKYYKALPPGVSPDAVDVYVINMMFPLDDPTGCLEHARKKLLVPGVRSGGKSMLKDVTEARDTLNRYITLMEAEEHTPGEDSSVDATPAPGTVMEDGWIVHSGEEMPEPLSDEQWVEVRLAGGHEWTGNYAKQAKDWVWGGGEGTVTRITHYRLLRFDTGSSIVGDLDETKRLVDDPDWFMHDGGPRPKGVAQRDKVLVRMSNGLEMVVPREAYKWCWEYRQDSPDAAPHIAAWRFA